MDVEERGGSRKLGVVEGGETVVRIYCMEEESIFKKKKQLRYFIVLREVF